MFMRRVSVVASGLLVVGLVGVAAPAATAATCVLSLPITATESVDEGASPAQLAAVADSGGCCISEDYSITSTAANQRIPAKGIGIIKDGPGGTVEVSKTQSGTVSLTGSASTEIEAGVVFAKAKVTLGGSITKDTTKTTSHTYSHDITKGKYGNLQWVNYGYKVTFRHFRTNATCTTTTLDTGSVTYPSAGDKKTEGWYYWETSS